jgi:precorrin-3B C17-methyltransferase
LYVVGIGPGDLSHLSARAREVLTAAEAVAGYSTYIDLVKPLVGNKKIVSTGMRKEVARVKAAIGLARQGKRCALISSGDAGVYAMAGLVLEICARQKIPISPHRVRLPGNLAHSDLYVEMVPGIPALCAGGALLGAPLTHDFAAISLSDLLTPWEKIKARLAAAAAADFVIVLYNPKSKKRRDHLQQAQEIVLQHRGGDTPVGIVCRAMRKGQRVQLARLDQLHAAEVDMQTIVFIGNSDTLIYGECLITPRGYREKYDL